MKKSRDNSPWWRTLLMIPIAVFAIVSILATGHDDDDDPPVDGDIPTNGDIPIGDLPATILSSYNYEIASLLGDVPFEASVGGALSIAVDFGDTLMGIINLDVSGTGDVNLVDYTIANGSTMSVTVSAISEPQLNGTVAIAVTETVTAPAFSIPTAGAFEITSTLLGTILVDIGASGVDLSLNGGTPESFTWDEYTDLLDGDGVPDWQRVASLSGGLLEFVYEYFLDAADLLDELELVTLSNPTTDGCEMFPGSPPMGVPEVGEVVFTWTGSGELSPGQNFEIQLNNCWDSDFEELTNGNINLTNYVEVIDSGNTLTSIGFAPEGTTAGGVNFVGFTVAETEESGSVFTINPLDTVTVSGGFSLLFTAP